MNLYAFTVHCIFEAILYEPAVGLPLTRHQSPADLQRLVSKVKGRMPDVCLTAYIDPGPLGRFAPVADTQGFAPRPLSKTSLRDICCGTSLSFVRHWTFVFSGWACRPGPPMAARRRAAARFFWRAEGVGKPLRIKSLLTGRRHAWPEEAGRAGAGHGAQACGRAGARLAALGHGHAEAWPGW